MRVLVVAVGLVLCSTGVFAQDLPIKMGLWERTVEMTNPVGKNMTTTTKSCITPASWQRMVTNAGRPHENCKIDTRKTGNGYTFSATCTVTAGVTMDISGTSKITDSEHVISDTHSVLTMNGQKKDTVTHAASRFVGANCGSVKPYEAEAAGK